MAILDVNNYTMYAYSLLILSFICSITQAMDLMNIDSMQQAEELINAGADINVQDKSGWTPLLYASMRGHKDGEYFLKLILSKEKDR